MRAADHVINAAQAHAQGVFGAGVRKPTEAIKFFACGSRAYKGTDKARLQYLNACATMFAQLIGEASPTGPVREQRKRMARNAGKRPRVLFSNRVQVNS